MSLEYDCVVVGSGHAGSCAALSAAQSGCQRVLIVEKAPEEWDGGNSYFTAGAHRTVHGGLQDLLHIVPNITDELAATIDIDPYAADDFTADIMRLSEGKSDCRLVQALVENSRDAIEWLARNVGINFTLSFNRQAYMVNGRQKFWGGMSLSVRDGGKGLFAGHRKALSKVGVEIWYKTSAIEIIMKENCLVGVKVKKGVDILTLTTTALILAAGGYESSANLRVKHLGQDWSRAMVRGTPFNTGDGIALASAVGAKLIGDWQGCHSTCWDANAPPNAGDRELSNQFTKSGYPLGIMINIEGHRFVDEGEDFRNYTYAKFGREILRQPGGFAFQVWDSQVIKWLREEEYGDGVVKKIISDSLEELSELLMAEGLGDQKAFLQTISDYNEAVRAHRREHSDTQWNPSLKDGLSTECAASNLSPPKSNWALTIERPPFMAVKVACGITFTFGGVAIDPETAGVISNSTGTPLRGLFSTGEMVGGLFYHNYPGGSGLTAGAVFGRKAGIGAASLMISGFH